MEWARTYNNISIIKGELPDCRFRIGEDPIPMISETTERSIICRYDASLKDKEQVEQLKKAAEKGSQWLWRKRKDHTWAFNWVDGTLGFTDEP